jgi:hypothetical protein
MIEMMREYDRDYDENIVENMRWNKGAAGRIP